MIKKVFKNNFINILFNFNKAGHTIHGDCMSIYLQLILAGLLWGSNVIVMKLIMQDIPFLLLAFLRVLMSMICLMTFMKVQNISFSIHDHKKILILSILSIYFNFFFTFLGMNEVKGIDNALMNSLAPIVTFILSWIILGKSGRLNEWIAIGLSSFAFLLSIHFQIFSIQIGFLYLLIGMIMYALANILIQKWHIENSLSIIFYELLYGSFFLGIHCLCIQQFNLSSLIHISIFYWLLFFIISGIGFAYIQIVYLKSVHQIGALKTSFYLSFNPLVTYVESLIFLNEEVDFYHIIAFLFIAFSIYIINKRHIQCS